MACMACRSSSRQESPSAGPHNADSARKVTGRSMGRTCSQITRFGSSRLERSAQSAGHPIVWDRIRERFDHSDYLITVLEECFAWVESWLLTKSSLLLAVSACGVGRLGIRRLLCSREVDRGRDDD